jgi:hypothetical protein
MNENEKKTEAEADHIEKVRRRAYAIWMDEGQVHGRDHEHWHQAESEITAETGAPTEAKPVESGEADTRRIPEPEVPEPEKSPKAPIGSGKITETPLRTGP